MPTDAELLQQIATLGDALSRRIAKHERVAAYDEGGCPIPELAVRARVTRAYRALMPLSEAPWGSLVVDSVQDRLEASGINTGAKDIDRRAWEVWQENSMDAESKLGHRSTFVDGRAFALVWVDPDDSDKAHIQLDDASTMIVQYREGSRRHRVAALRRWVDETDRAHATLYRPDGIYKFIEPEEQSGSTSRGIDATSWERREARGEPWPLRNPLNRVPVVEVAVNRRLAPGGFPYARGEYEHCIGLIDRINLLTFLGLVVAFWQGFPLRGVIGQALMKDDDGNTIPPFDATADSIFHLPDSTAKTAEYGAADRKNLSVHDELDQLAVVTKTPRHYFPMQNGMSNLAADAIRASEGALHAKATGHKASLGEGWEEVLRLCGMVEAQSFVIPAGAELGWLDHESRSLAERADAATKLKDILPPEAIMDIVLNVTQEQVDRWATMGASNALSALVRGIGEIEPVVEPEPEPAAA